MKKSVAGLIFATFLISTSSAQGQQSSAELCSAASECARDGNYGAACAYYEKALRVDHGSSVRRLAAQAWINYGKTQGGTRAARCFRRAHDLDPTNSQAQNSLQSQLKSTINGNAAALTTQTYGVMAAPGVARSAGMAGHANGGYSASALSTPGSFSGSYSSSQGSRPYAAASSAQSYRRVVREGNSNNSAPEPRSYFLAQNNDPRWNRDAPANDANCAPTCLAMACKRFNMFPQSASQTSSPQELILNSRYLMTGTLNEGHGTTPMQLAYGARQIGFKTQYVNTVADVEQAIDRGAVCAIGGCPWVDRSYGPRYKGRNYPVFHNGHCILVVGKQAGYYIVSDPLYFDGPINVSSAELEAFLTWHNNDRKGVALNP